MCKRQRKGERKIETETVQIHQHRREKKDEKVFFLLCFSRRKRTFEKISTKLIKENGYKKDSYPHFHLPSKDTNHQTPSHA